MIFLFNLVFLCSILVSIYGSLLDESSEALVDGLYGACDIGGLGSITLDHIVACTSHAHPQHEYIKTTLLGGMEPDFFFKLVDTDNDGYLTRSEYRQVLQELIDADAEDIELIDRNGKRTVVSGEELLRRMEA